MKCTTCVFCIYNRSIDQYFFIGGVMQEKEFNEKEKCGTQLMNISSVLN